MGDLCRRGRSRVDGGACLCELSEREKGTYKEYGKSGSIGAVIVQDDIV